MTSTRTGSHLDQGDAAGAVMGRYDDEVAGLATPLTDPGDLDALLDRVGDARVVMLGEATHGTHEFYTWRAAISRRLIEEKGCQLLLVECALVIVGVLWCGRLVAGLSCRWGCLGFRFVTAGSQDRVRVVRGYRFALDLSPCQERLVWSQVGAARVAFNWGLARVKAVLDQRAAERSYGVPDDQLTPALGWSLAALRREWNAAKGEVAPWWRECSKEAFNTGLDALARALANWSTSRSGVRVGRRVGFPRFRSRRRAVASVRFTTGAIRVEPDRKHVVLPRLGRLRLHESARKLARRLEAGTARILSATVRRDGGRWFVSFTVDVERTIRPAARVGSVVGVDVGVRHLAVLSTGELVPNPRHLDRAQRRLRALSRVVSRRRGPDRRTRRRPSNRWRRAQDRLARAHARVANLRRDGLHKLTTRLARTHGTVVVEDLHVAGMLANRRLARHIADVGFGELRRQLTYKTDWAGGRLVVADRWYPSSKTCSACGVVKAKLALSERVYTCDACGLVLDRDLNAARNLATLADAEVDDARSGRESENGRGADRKTPLAGRVAEKRQPGTATAGKTGTVPPQGGTTDHALTKAH